MVKYCLSAFEDLTLEHLDGSFIYAHALILIQTQIQKSI